MVSRSSRVAIVSIVTGGFLGAPAFAQAPKLPLSVDRTSTSNGPPGGPMMLSINLHNNGTKDITAWGYWIALRLDDGTTRQDPRTSDALPATEPADYIVAANGFRTETFFLPDVRPATVTGVTVTVAAVIFDDAMASGDESLLTSLFARRAQHRQTWNALHTLVSEAQARYSDPSEVLEKVKADIEVADPKLRDSGDYVILRKMALVGLQGARPQSAQDVLRNLVRIVTTHRDMFERQTTRR
jgi:hypothetical protein